MVRVAHSAMADALARLKRRANVAGRLDLTGVRTRDLVDEGVELYSEQMAQQHCGRTDPAMPFIASTVIAVRACERSER